MCVQFHVRKISILLEQANDIDHEGKPYTNPDFPFGSIYCEDMEGNLYAYRHDPRDENNAWPSKTKKGIPLYRDYWRHIAPARGTPYTRAILNAKQRILKEV